MYMQTLLFMKEIVHLCKLIMHILSLVQYISYFSPKTNTHTHTERQYMNMYEAVRHGDMESLMTALASGLSVDCRDKYNKTPLMVACSHGRLDVAKFLLERG